MTNLAYARKLTVTGFPVYGLSRLGEKQANKLVYNTSFTISGVDTVGSLIPDSVLLSETELIDQPPITQRKLGKKLYELSNHLGNVLATIFDRHVHTVVSSDTLWDADIASAQDYYPFGMTIPDRSFVADGGKYKYGFNGMERDDEMNGNGNSYDYGARIYDSRLGRWLARDPKAIKYPGHSSYHFGYNSPLIVIDPDGKENVIVIGGHKQYKASGENVGPYSDQSNPNNNKNGQRYFLDEGLNWALTLSANRQVNGESTTMLVYKGDYSETELSAYQKKAEENGIKFIQVDNADAVNTYVNEKNAANPRSEDLITDFVYVGHGNPFSKDAFLLGYPEDYSDHTGPINFSGEAFSTNCNVMLLGCNNGKAALSDFKQKVGGEITGYRTEVIWGVSLEGNYGFKGSDLGSGAYKKPNYDDFGSIVTLKGTGGSAGNVNGHPNTIQAITGHELKDRQSQSSPADAVHPSIKIN